MVARPIQALIGKSKKFEWDESSHHAFVNLRDAITKAHTLKIADFENPYVLLTDASDVAIGGCIEQYEYFVPSHSSLAVFCQLKKMILK
jgi:hypothetical protein